MSDSLTVFGTDYTGVTGIKAKGTGNGTLTYISDWIPALTSALWKITALENEIPEWVQPLGAHDAYNKRDRVIYNNIIWESTIDVNVYEPGVYGWDEVE